jgi:hypothetical protein
MRGVVAVGVWWGRLRERTLNKMVVNIKFFHYFLAFFIFIFIHLLFLLILKISTLLNANNLFLEYFSTFFCILIYVSAFFV